MSDFYSLLKQSILDRGISDAADRDEVYAQARQAMVDHLWTYQPPLAEDDIERRIAAFDAAVDRIEVELAMAFDEMADGEPDYHGKRPYRPLPPRDRHADVDEPSSLVPRPPVAAAPEAEPAPPNYDKARRSDDRWAPDPAPRAYRRGQLSALAARARRGGLSERDKIRILAGTIGVLAVILIGFGFYLVRPARESSVTLPIESRNQVSDAATAQRNAAAPLAIQQTFVVFNGRDPTVFESSSDNPIDLASDGDGGFARVSSSTDSAGVRVVIGAGLASELAGKRMRVTITARSSADRGAVNMRFAYQSGLAVSPWQTANLGKQYADAALIWRVPSQRTSSTGDDYLVIEPGIPGGGTAADVKSIKIDLLAPSSS